MTWAMEQQLVTDPHACSVLIALGNHADRDGTGAFPSVETLRRYTKLSERTIRTKLAELEATGIIRRGNQAIAAAHIERADRRPVVWDLAMELGVQEMHPAQETGVQQAHPVNATGCSSRRHGVQLVQERGARAAPKPSLNHPEPGISPGAPAPADFTGSFEGHGDTAPKTTPGATAAGAIAADLRRRGYRITSTHPDLLAAVAEGVTPDRIAEFAELYPADHSKCRGSPGYVISAARRQLADTADPISPGAPREPHRRLSAVERVRANVEAAERRDAAQRGSAHGPAYPLAADG